MEFSSLNKLTPSNYSSTLQISHFHPTYTGTSPAIALTTNFQQQEHSPYIYSRLHNPNFTLLEKQLAHLHGGKEATVFASGMAAISATLFSLIHPNQTILCSDEIYYEVNFCLKNLSHLMGMKIIKVDVCNTEATLTTAQAIKDLCLIYLESSTNPSSRMVDLPVLSTRLRQLKIHVPIVIDNTWLSPALYQPLRHGASVVIESATKYISGRGDVLLGAAITNDNKIKNKITSWRSVHGAVPSPFNCWMVSKALETLPLRMERICHSAQIIATMLQQVPCITRVLHPSLPNHPTHKLAKQLLGEYTSGVVCFHLPLNKAAAKKFTTQIEPVLNATSYGEAHTLINSPTPGSSALFATERDTKVLDVEGHWFRLAVGLAPPEEILRSVLLGLAQHFATPLGTVKTIYRKIEVVEISINSKSSISSLQRGDLLVTNLETSNNRKQEFYAVQDTARFFSKSHHNDSNILTVKILPGIKRGDQVYLFQRHH